jgi:hypothetical protein
VAVAVALLGVVAPPAQAQEALPDIAVSVTAAPNPATVGQAVTYSYVVLNESDVAAPDTVLRVVLNGGLDLPGTTVLIGSSQPCAQETTGGPFPTQDLVCHLGDLAPGDDAVLTVTAAMSEPGMYGRSSFAQSAAGESDYSDNSPKVAVVVEESSTPPDLLSALLAAILALLGL